MHQRFELWPTPVAASGSSMKEPNDIVEDSSTGGLCRLCQNFIVDSSKSAMP